MLGHGFHPQAWGSPYHPQVLPKGSLLVKMGFPEQNYSCTGAGTRKGSQKQLKQREISPSQLQKDLIYKASLCSQIISFFLKNIYNNTNYKIYI